MFHNVVVVVAKSVSFFNPDIFAFERNNNFKKLTRYKHIGSYERVKLGHFAMYSFKCAGLIVLCIVFFYQDIKQNSVHNSVFWYPLMSAHSPSRHRKKQECQGTQALKSSLPLSRLLIIITTIHFDKCQTLLRLNHVLCSLL